MCGWSGRKPPTSSKWLAMDHQGGLCSATTSWNVVKNIPGNFPDDMRHVRALQSSLHPPAGLLYPPAGNLRISVDFQEQVPFFSELLLRPRSCDRCVLLHTRARRSTSPAPHCRD